MAKMLSVRVGQWPGPNPTELQTTGKVQPVFAANPNRKGGFIQNQGLRASPLRVYLGEDDCTSLEAGKAVQFGEYRGDIWVVGEYGEQVVAREFYSEP